MRNRIPGPKAAAGLMIGLAGLCLSDVTPIGHTAGNDGVPELVGRTHGQSLAIDVEGERLVTAVAGQLVVADVGDRATARIVGRGPAWPGVVFGLDIAGDRVYAAIGGHGIRVVDISHPATPREIGVADTPGEAGAVVVDGGLAYVADGSAGLRVLDVADPYAIREIGSLDTPGDAVGVAVGGGYAYVADYDGGLASIDVRDPRRPAEVWRQVVAGGGGKVWSVALDGHLLAVTIDPGTVWLLDVSISDTPMRLFETTLLAGVHNEVRLLGSKMLISGPYGLSIIDRERGWGGGNAGLSTGARSLATDGRRVFALTNDGLAVEIDVDSTPFVLGPWLRLVDPAFNIAVAGDRAIVAGGGKLVTYDIEARPMPRQVGSVEMSETVRALALGSGHAIVATGSAIIDDGLPKQVRMFDVAPASGSGPVEIAALAFTETPRDIVVEGDRAYVAFGTSVGNGGGMRYKGGIRVLDVSNPRAPTVIGAWIDANMVERLAVVRGIVYAIGRRGDVSQALNDRPFLRIIDATEPAALKIMADRTATSPSTLAYAGLAAAGDRLVLYWSENAYQSGVAVLDVSDPGRPAEQAVLTVDDMIVDGALQSDRLVLASTGSVRTDAGGQRIDPIATVRLRGIDLADARKPRQTYLVEVPQGDAYAKDLAVDGDTITVATGLHGLWVFDTSGRDVPPETPVPTATAVVSATPTASQIPPTAGAPSATATREPTASPTAPVAPRWRAWLPRVERETATVVNP